MPQMQETLLYFAVACRSRVVNEVTAPYEEGECSQAYFLGEMTDVKDSNEAWTVKLPIQGIEIDFKIDSGAHLKRLLTC